MKIIALCLAVAIGLTTLFSCSGEVGPEARIAKLRKLVEQEKYEAAIEEVNKLIPSRPTDSAVLFLGAKAYLAAGQADTAVSYAKKLTALYPEHMEGYRLLRTAADKIRDFDAEIWAVSQLAYKEGNRPKYYPELAELNFRRGQYGLSMATCREILKNDPENPQALFLLANNMSSVGLIDSAILIMEDLDRKNPEQVEIISNLASFMATKRDYAQAVVHFQRLTSLFPDYVPGWFGLGHMRLSLGDTTGAVTAYRQVYSRDSSFLGIDSILQTLERSPIH